MNNTKIANPDIISVIVLAHDRKEFLLDALTSVARQSLPINRFEVIVVKNFENEEIDSFIAKNGFKNLLTSVSNLGAKIVLGVKNSSGKIITFLEDDDIYEPERLRVIESQFLSHKSMIYFHNNFQERDSKLRPLSRTKFPMVKNIKVIDSRNISLSTVNWAISHSTQANLSSIAVLKETMEPLLELFHLSNGGEDLAIFIQSLNTPGEIRFFPISLTLVRIHQSFFTSHNSSDLKNDIIWRINRNRGYLETYKKVLTLTYGNNVLANWINHAILYRRMIGEILEDTSVKKISNANFLFELIFVLKYRLTSRFPTILIFMIFKLGLLSGSHRFMDKLMIRFL